MTDIAPGTIVSIDFGSTHVAPAMFGADGPEEIEVGKSKGEFGDETQMFLYPTTFIFPAEPPREIPKHIPNEGTGIQLAGFRPSPGQEVVYGIKQALDVSLCKLGSQGTLMRTLCAHHGPVEAVLDDNLTKIFALIWKKIEEHRQKKGYGPPEQAWITVPASYTQGRTGFLLQDQLARCAISGGFPAAIGLKSEMEAVFHYLNYLRRKEENGNEPDGQRRTEREIIINCGGGVVDVSAIERLGQAMQLLCKSDSRDGGISDVFTQLQAKCKELKLPPGSFRILEQHIYGMDKSCQSIEIGGQSFVGELLRKMIVDAYEEGFVLAESIIRKIDKATKVYIFGRPPASNKLIGDICVKRFSDLRARMRKEGRKADFEVEILASDIASKAVHLGACIPFVDNPVMRFREVCFGYIISTRVRRKGRWVETNRFQEVKAPNSDELETYWEALQADDEDASTLTIKPHTINAKHWKPLTNMRSGQTHRPVAPIANALSMDIMKVDLKGQAKPNQWIWVRFKRKHPDLYPTLYKLQVDCRERDWEKPESGEKECIEEEYELCCDSERCYFIPVDEHQVDDEDARSVRDEISDSQLERPVRRKRHGGPLPRGSAAGDRLPKVRKTGPTKPQKSATRSSDHQQKRDPYDGPSSDNDSEMQGGRCESGVNAPHGSHGSLAEGRNMLDTPQRDPSLRPGQMKSIPQSSRESISSSTSPRIPSQAEDRADKNLSQHNTGRMEIAERSSDKPQADSHTSSRNPVTPTSARRSGLRSQLDASLVLIQPTNPSKQSKEGLRQSHQNPHGDENAIRTADDTAAEDQLIPEVEQLGQAITVTANTIYTAVSIQSLLEDAL